MTINNLLQACLDEELKQVCPIHGVSFKDINDKSTWRVDYEEKADQAQREKAKEILDNFIWDDNKKNLYKKKIRDIDFYSQLIYRHGFLIYKKENPDSSFSDYIDYLENTKF